MVRIGSMREREESKMIQSFLKNYVLTNSLNEKVYNMLLI